MIVLLNHTRRQLNMVARSVGVLALILKAHLRRQSLYWQSSSTPGKKKQIVNFRSAHLKTRLPHTRKAARKFNKRSYVLDHQWAIALST